MNHVVALLAIAILAAAASPAEARGRVRLRLSPSVAATPKPSPERGSGFLPGAAIGATLGGRSGWAGEERGSGAASGRPTLPLPPAGDAPAPSAPSKPAFVCAADRTVGAGTGFCEVN